MFLAQVGIGRNWGWEKSIKTEWKSKYRFKKRNTMEYYIAIKITKVQLYTTVWMNCRNINLEEKTSPRRLIKAIILEKKLEDKHNSTITA